MSWDERALWIGLGYCYEAFRAGYPKKDCDLLAQQYIALHWKGDE